jgi:hypothetical protein
MWPSGPGPRSWRPREVHVVSVTEILRVPELDELGVQGSSRCPEEKILSVPPRRPCCSAVGIMVIGVRVLVMLPVALGVQGSSLREVDLVVLASSPLVSAAKYSGFPSVVGVELVVATNLKGSCPQRNGLAWTWFSSRVGRGVREAEADPGDAGSGAELGTKARAAEGGAPGGGEVGTGCSDGGRR